jgi:hypothetical protein
MGCEIGTYGGLLRLRLFWPAIAYFAFEADIFFGRTDS